jgi:hypothetical protein
LDYNRLDNSLDSMIIWGAGGGGRYKDRLA